MKLQAATLVLMAILSHSSVSIISGQTYMGSTPDSTKMPVTPSEVEELIGETYFSTRRFTRIAPNSDQRVHQKIGGPVLYQRGSTRLQDKGLRYYAGIDVGKYKFGSGFLSGGSATYGKFGGVFVGLEKLWEGPDIRKYLGSRVAFSIDTRSEGEDENFEDTYESYIYYTDSSRTYIHPSILFYGQYDWQCWGVGVSFNLLPNGIYGFGYPHSGKALNLLAGLYLRLGPPKIHLTAGINGRQFMRSDPFYGHIGIGFNSTDSTGFLIGLTNLSGYNPAFMLGGKLKYGPRTYELLLISFEGIGLGLNLPIGNRGNR